jgi:hypothetical protein
MYTIEKVQPYQALINRETIKQWNGVVRVWNEPKSLVEGAEVIDEIKEPVEVTVVEEQKGMYGSKAQRAKIIYGTGKEGWVFFDVLNIKVNNGEELAHETLHQENLLSGLPEAGQRP